MAVFKPLRSNTSEFSYLHAMNLSTSELTTFRFDAQAYDLSRVTVGLNWRVARSSKGLFKRLLGTPSEGFDLDASAILLDMQDKLGDFGSVRDLGGGRKVGLIDSDVIFYNNLQHPSGAIWHTGDDLKAGSSKDNEQLVLDLVQLPARYSKVLFSLCIHQGQSRAQHFAMVSQFALDLCDASGRQICELTVTDTQPYHQLCTLVVAALYRLPDGGWQLQQVLEGYESDSIVEVLKSHV
jgi:tellurium resistance protein TerD